MAPSSFFKFSNPSLTLVFFAAHAYAQTCVPPPTIDLSFGNCTFLYNDTVINSYGILVGVGDSGDSQSLCVMPSTVVNSTMLQSSEICDSDQLDKMTLYQCLSRRGGVVMRDALPSASIDTLADLNPGWVSLTSGSTNVTWQYAVQAALQLKDQAVTMLEGLITQGQLSTMSHLGLAESSPLLQALKDEGLIGALSWGLNAGSQSYSAPRIGSLVLGGYDEESIEGDFFTFPISSQPVQQRPCPLQVNINELTLTVRNVSLPMITQSNPLVACIEPYDNLFRLPSNYLGQVTSLVNGALPLSQGPVSPTSYNSTLLDLEPGLVYPASAGPITASLRIALDNGLSVDIPSYELVRPLRGLDTNGSPIVDTDFNEVQIYYQADPENGPVLGKGFLSQLYLYVDYEASTFSLARQNLDATTPISKSSASCPALTNTDKGLIAIGVVLGVVLVGLLAFVVVRYLRAKPKAKQRANANVRAFGNGVPPHMGSDEDIRPPSGHSFERDR